MRSGVAEYHRDGIRDREARGRRGETGISALYPIAGAHATADTPVGRSRSETQVAHYAAVKPDNRSVGGGGSGGGGGGGDGSGGSGGGSNGSGSDSSTRTGTDKLDGLPIPLISVPGAENAAGQLWKANFYRRTTARLGSGGSGGGGDDDRGRFDETSETR